MRCNQDERSYSEVSINSFLQHIKLHLLTLYEIWKTQSIMSLLSSEIIEEPEGDLKPKTQHIRNFGILINCHTQESAECQIKQHFILTVTSLH